MSGCNVVKIILQILFSYCGVQDNLNMKQEKLLCKTAQIARSEKNAKIIL